jgi:hypothetical protein
MSVVPCRGFRQAWLLLLFGTLGACLLQVAIARPYQLGYSMKEQQSMLPLKTCYEDILPVQQSVQSLTGVAAALVLQLCYP